MHHPVTTAFPFTVIFAQLIAEVTSGPFSWSQTLVVYGPLGLWVFWFIIRDLKDREDRKLERLDMERRHQENLKANAEVRDALRDTINLVIVAIGGVKNMDSNFTALAERIKANGDQRK